MSLPYFSFYPKDFLADTMAMSPEAGWAYIKILCFMWGTPRIKESEIKTIGFGSVSVSFGFVNEVLEKLETDGEFFWSKRLEIEREKCEKRHNSKVQNGKKGGRPKKETEEKPIGCDSLKLTESTNKKNHTSTNVEEQLSNDNCAATSEQKPKKRFTVPSVEEIKTMIEQKGYNVNAERFWAFYESNGWMVGKNKMRSWPAALVTWNNSNQVTQQPQRQQFLTAAERDRDERNELAKQIKADGGIFATFARN